jgi:CheY-like chemotaxis protein
MRSAQKRTCASRTTEVAGYRILVVDDDPQALKLLSRILARGGYEVHTAESGRRGLDLLETAEPFDLLVLDLNMPAPDGFDVLKQVRATQPGLRTLVISGFMGGALLAAAELLGATATLNKADAPRLLLSLVGQLLQRR